MGRIVGVKYAMRTRLRAGNRLLTHSAIGQFVILDKRIHYR